MVTQITRNLFVLIALAAPGSQVFADRFVASYSCEFNSDMDFATLQASNETWLNWVRDNVSEKVTSEVGVPVTGSEGRYLFIDGYPDLATWEATQKALGSEAADELKALFADAVNCTHHQLWAMESPN